MCVGESSECGDGVLQAGCGEECDDGNTSSGDGCSALCLLEFACHAAPDAGCRRQTRPNTGELEVDDKPRDRNDEIVWSWASGAATTKANFGNPRTTTGYLLCIYDASTLVSTARAPAGGTCAGEPCWKKTDSGFKYVDPQRTPDGIVKLQLIAGKAGKARIEAELRGVDIDMPSLPLAQPVTVQVKNSNGICWEAVYSAPAEDNDSDDFEDRND
jgi:cysteine-rich repeat protein